MRKPLPSTHIVNTVWHYSTSSKCSIFYKGIITLCFFVLDCSWPQGVGNGNMPDSQISASTSFNDLHLPYHGRLGNIAPNSLGGWCPYKDGTSEHLQFDLADIKKVSGKCTMTNAY
ncbi:lactadherin-like [Hydractinia symbiolongicarpus]|uniref:lactadherin-like n=1 Tax=Hydractinia symbiolongicarpus TaxID=13093 RepID=UPI00254F03A4|nr:lactadherin-like [Hydractinia symbiolongicarpus]